MTPSKEQNRMQANSKFLEAEMMIKQAIAGMDEETHIEYDSTKIHKMNPSKWTALLRNLTRKKQ
jgi:hypothetical protein